jgi:hypothetical protein
VVADQSWRTPDGRWLVDRVSGEPGVAYRLWDWDRFAGELPIGNRDALEAWLDVVGVSVDDLQPEAEDPYCE